jgi:hypothetical protein
MSQSDRQTTPDSGEPISGIRTGNPMLAAAITLFRVWVETFRGGPSEDPTIAACQRAFLIYFQALVSHWFETSKMLLGHLQTILDADSSTAEAAAPAAPAEAQP